MSITKTTNSTEPTVPNSQKPITRWTQIPELIDSDTLENLLHIHLTIANVATYLNYTRSDVISAMKAHEIERQTLIIPESMKKKLRI